MIYLILMQYMKRRMQITQESLDYGLMTNPLKFVQQTTSSLSKGDSSVCN